MKRNPRALCHPMTDEKREEAVARTIKQLEEAARGCITFYSDVRKGSYSGLRVFPIGAARSPAEGEDAEKFWEQVAFGDVVDTQILLAMASMLGFDVEYWDPGQVGQPGRMRSPEKNRNENEGEVT